MRDGPLLQMAPQNIGKIRIAFGGENRDRMTGKPKAEVPRSKGEGRDQGPPRSSH